MTRTEIYTRQMIGPTVVSALSRAHNDAVAMEKAGWAVKCVAVAGAEALVVYERED